MNYMYIRCTHGALHSRIQTGSLLSGSEESPGIGYTLSNC